MEEGGRIWIRQDHQQRDVAGRGRYRSPPVQRGLKADIAKQRHLTRAIKPRPEVAGPKIRRLDLQPVRVQLF